MAVRISAELGCRARLDARVRAHLEELASERAEF
jgi:hypothetical protein